MAASASPPATPISYRKYALWIVMALAAISVYFNYEIPLLRKHEEQVHLHDHLGLLFTHAIAGLVAFLTGPTQFSTRLRRHSLRTHRILGRVYVAAVFLAAPLAIWSTAYAGYAGAFYFRTAIAFQGTAWLTATAVAFIAAIQRRIATHRQWMIRSYAVTFTFIGTRVLQVFRAFHFGRFGAAVMIICLTTTALFVPQIARAIVDIEARIRSLAAN